MESWKEIDGYEQLYLVSSEGRIFSKKRSKMLTPIASHHGYLRIQLFNNGVFKNHAVHRLVAKAFIPNPDNLPEVNHRNENASDNRAENLEWCTRKYNTNYGSRTEKTRKKVAMMNEDGSIAQVFESQVEAARVSGARQGAICNACRGVCKTAGGYRWSYV